MQKNPSKDMHVQLKKRWPNRNRLQTKTGGEIGQMRSRLETLLKEASRKNLQIGELLKLKGSEGINLHAHLAQAFKKHSGLAAQKVLAKTNMELSNHLHHIERELGFAKVEMKRLCSKAQALSALLRKKSS